MPLFVGETRSDKFHTVFGEEIVDVVLTNPETFRGRIRYRVYIPAGGARPEEQVLLDAEIREFDPNSEVSLRGEIKAAPRGIRWPLWHSLTNLGTTDANVDDLDVAMRFRRGR